ncbi:hypothetical protein HAX54_036573 [Datura stramonium]|uniref:Uncharacterized protein n=1 Tax=Datura stramonium TaxID=4076 RepID=A0ABS8VIA4_DATST|nr:hypothetical protein [Datura stramonium]
MPSFGEWSHYPNGLPCVETIKLVDKMWHTEEKDTMLLVMMKQMELLTSWKNVQFVDINNQGNTEVLPSVMESTLKVVLEKVLATEEGVQDLRSILLDLTTTIKIHEVVIQQLEERMNKLAFQMATPIATNNASPRKNIMDDDDLEWEMEEEAIEVLIVDVSLKGEELNEIHHVYKEVINYSFPPRKMDLDLKNHTTPSSQPSCHALPWEA